MVIAQHCLLKCELLKLFIIAMLTALCILRKARKNIATLSASEYVLL